MTGKGLVLIHSLSLKRIHIATCSSDYAAVQANRNIVFERPLVDKSTLRSQVQYSFLLRDYSGESLAPVAPVEKLFRVSSTINETTFDFHDFHTLQNANWDQFGW